VYRILWHDRESDNLSPVPYSTIREAVRVATEIREAYCQHCAPGYDVVFAEIGRIVPDWFRQMQLEHVN